MPHKNRKGFNKQKLKRFHDKQYPVKVGFWAKIRNSIKALTGDAGRKK